MDRPLTDDDIHALVLAFYDRVRVDPLLAPVFAAGVADWDDHHRRLTDFWSSVMFASGRYEGNPVALHLRHAPAMTPDRFARWLALWGETADAVLAPQAAAAVRAKAVRIAESLQLAIAVHGRSAEPAPPAPTGAGMPAPGRRA